MKKEEFEQLRSLRVMSIEEQPGTLTLIEKPIAELTLKEQCLLIEAYAKELEKAGFDLQKYSEARLQEYLKVYPVGGSYEDTTYCLQGYCPDCGRGGFYYTWGKHIHLCACHLCKTYWRGNDITTGAYIQNEDDAVRIAKLWLLLGTYKKVNGFGKGGDHE